VERFGFELGPAGTGVIVAEQRDATLDRQLELAWLDLKISGTANLSPSAINRRIQSLNLRGKTDNIAGLQLADLVVSPIGRHVAGKTAREDFRIIEAKFRRDAHGNYDGHGLVILPTQ